MTLGERNTLLFDGISTFIVGPAGVCEIDRSITTYQQNASGQPDNSYLNTNIMFQAMYAAHYTAAQITSQYIVPGKILVANGTIIPPDSSATTPIMILGMANRDLRLSVQPVPLPERAAVRGQRDRRLRRPGVALRS